MSNSLQADAIINALKDQANTILSAALGSTPLQSFQIGALGNMKYYWQDPRNLEFNRQTYDWINSSLNKGAPPLQQGGPFTNTFIDVFAKVNYSLSTADQAKLNEAKDAATDQQMALLNAWKAAYGSLPPATSTEQPIDIITSTIATTWANPATTLTAIQEAININQLLNNVPASGKPIVPVLSNYLNAIVSALSLENAVTMSNAYLGRALAAAQTASATNGGLPLNDGTVVPAYAVATSLADIIKGLKNPNSPANLNMTVTRSTESEYTVSMEGSTSFSIPILDFLTLNVGANASYFQSDMATTDNETTVNMSFPGVTLVNFGPVDFSEATMKSWYWVDPIKDAIKNGNTDVSGFKFSPAPPPSVDFGQYGNFSYLMGAAISNYPTMSITVKSSNYQRIQTTFQQAASVGITFLGIPLGIGGKEGTYSNKVTTDSSNSTVTIDLSPPPELVAGNAVDSVGWVLGVQPKYPTAS